MADQFWQPYWNNVDRRRQNTRYQNALARQDMLDQRGVRADKESFVADQVQSIAALPEEQRPQAWQQGVASYERLFGETVQPQLRQYNPQVFQGLAGRFAPEQVVAADNRNFIREATTPTQQFSDVGPYVGGMQRPEELTKKPLSRNALATGMVQRDMITGAQYLDATAPAEVDYQLVQDASGQFIRVPKQPGFANSPTGVVGDPDQGKVEIINSPQNIPKFEMDLRKEFQSLPVVKQFDEIQGQVKRLDEAMKEARGEGSKVAVDQALITILNKMLDPNSVVRESEYARTAGDLGVMSQIKGKWEKLLQGGAGLTPQERESIYRMARRFAKVAQDKYQTERRYYSQIAKNRNIPVSNILRPFDPTDFNTSNQGDNESKDYSDMTDEELINSF